MTTKATWYYDIYSQLNEPMEAVELAQQLLGAALDGRGPNTEIANVDEALK